MAVVPDLAADQMATSLRCARPPGRCSSIHPRTLPPSRPLEHRESVIAPIACDRRARRGARRAKMLVLRRAARAYAESLEGRPAGEPPSPGADSTASSADDRLVPSRCGPPEPREAAAGLRRLPPYRVASQQGRASGVADAWPDRFVSRRRRCRKRTAASRAPAMPACSESLEAHSSNVPPLPKRRRGPHISALPVEPRGEAEDGWTVPQLGLASAAVANQPASSYTPRYSLTTTLSSLPPDCLEKARALFQSRPPPHNLCRVPALEPFWAADCLLGHGTLDHGTADSLLDSLSQHL